MANIPELSSFDANVYEWDTADPVKGGDTGIAVVPIKSLTNRTRWLYDQVAAILTALNLKAPLASPSLTGTATAPTPAVGDNSTKISTTAFVNTSRSGVVTINVAGNSNVTLTAPQYGCGIIIFTGALSDNINVIFPANGSWIVSNGTSGSYSLTCKTAGGSGVSIDRNCSAPIMGDGNNIAWQDTALGGNNMGRRNVYIQNGGYPSGGNDGDIFLIY